MRLPDRLPPIAGWGRLLFMVVWLLSLAAAVIAPLGGAWFRLPAIGSTAEGVSLAIDLLPPALLVAAAILLWLRRRQDSVAALLSLSFLMMSAAFFAAEGFFRGIELGWVRDVFAHAGRCLLMLVLLTFPDGRFSPRWSVWVAAGLLIWAPVALARPWPLTVEYLGYLVFLALSVLSIAIPYRRLAGGLERQQVRWVLFGFAGGTMLLVLATAVSLLPGGASMPGVKSGAALAAQMLAALGMACFALGLIVSLLRYRLYDAEAAISRSAGYALLTLLLGLTFAVSAKTLEYLVETYLGQEAGGLSGAIAAGLAVLLVTPLNARIQDWAERRFQKDLLTLRRDLPECMADLRETAQLGELLDEALARVEAGVRAVRSAISMEGRIVAQRGPGSDDGTAFAIRLPLRAGEAAPETATLLVGPRPDGTRPGKDEREALQEIAAPVARAIEVVRRRKAREAALDARLNALEREVAALAGKSRKAGSAE
jgi:hypothetical protein